MDSSLAAACGHYQRCQYHLDGARRSLSLAEERAVAQTADFAAAARKRGARHDDDAAVEAAIAREDARAEVDADLKLALLRADALWTLVRVTTPGTDLCGREACWFRANPDKISEMDGYMECVYARGWPDRRLCTRCYAQTPNPVGLAVAMRRLRNVNTSVEDVLLRESRKQAFAVEAAGSRVTRALLPDEWRMGTPPMPCVACTGGKTPAVRCVAVDPRLALCASTHVSHAAGPRDEAAWTPVARFQACLACAAPASRLLIGWPAIRLCAAHFESRAALLELLIRQAHRRFRVDP